MASLNDAFEMSRIPLKPLAFSNNDLAQCNEFMIDYDGDEPSYHMYIVDSSDNTIFIDLTAKMIKEILPTAPINANNFTLNIEGISEPESLQDLLNFIYKRFTYPDNPNGFVYDRDKDKLYNPTTKSILLRDTSGTVYLPITTAENVFDNDGVSLQQRLDNMTRFGFGVTYARSSSVNQSEYIFTYPFKNYSDMVEVRIGTTYVDKSRYSIQNIEDTDGNWTTATLKFTNMTVEANRRVDLVFMYNVITKADGNLEFMSGSRIANYTISSNKLEKTSDSYTLNDSTSIATSAAVYNLFTDMASSLNDLATNTVWAMDTSTTSTTITASTTKAYSQPFLLNIPLKTNKTASSSGITLNMTFNGSAYNAKLYNPDGSLYTKGLLANKTIRVLRFGGTYYLVSGSMDSQRISRYSYTCVDQQYTIPFNGLDYNNDSIIYVYRNGVRQFVDINYSINYSAETISLFTRTEEGEIFVFEAVTM